MIEKAAEAMILVVDDEPDNLRLALEMLRKHGLEVLTARNGTDALRIAGRLLPDLILLDVRMPGLDGFEVCIRLRDDPATHAIPVIFVSALRDIDDKTRGFQVGGVDYVTKPFDAKELMLRVCTHMRLAAQRGNAHDPAPEQPPRTTAADSMSRDLSLLLNARDRLLRELADPPDLEALARQCGTNRTKLGLLFKEHIGLSVYQYHREQRLQCARRLLREGGASVHSIALAVGYSGGAELTRAFRARFSVTPGALRESAEAEPSD